MAFMLAKTTTEHISFNSEAYVFLSNLFFLECQASSGGAIFSNILVSHIIESCCFYRCNATDSKEGRGAAMHLAASSKSIVKYCCSEGCNTPAIGADFLIILPIKFEYIQCFRSTNGRHGIWIKSDSSTSLKHLNVSYGKNVMKNLAYGTSINIAVTEEGITLRFFNFMSNTGEMSVLEFENMNFHTVYANYVNIVNNIDQISYLSFYKCKNAKIILSNSYFIQNSGNEFYDSINSEECSLEFVNCAFSIGKYDNRNDILLASDCIFQVVSYNSDVRFTECAMIFKITLPQQMNQNWKLFIHLSLIYFYFS